MKNQSTKSQFIRYFIVGVGGASIDTITFTILTYILNINYLIANIFAFLAGFSFAYPLSVKWVFKSSKNKNKFLEIFLFIALSGLGLLVQQGVLFLSVDKFLLPKIIGKFLAIISVIGWNFFTRKIFIFN